jgi:hypothetical protein
MLVWVVGLIFPAGCYPTRPSTLATTLISLCFYSCVPNVSLRVFGGHSWGTVCCKMLVWVVGLILAAGCYPTRPSTLATTLISLCFCVLCSKSVCSCVREVAAGNQVGRAPRPVTTPPPRDPSTLPDRTQTSDKAQHTEFRSSAGKSNIFARVEGRVEWQPANRLYAQTQHRDSHRLDHAVKMCIWV